MSDSYTASLRLDQPQVGGDSNTWGGILNTDLALIDTAIAGLSSIALSGSNITLTANNGAADQSRAIVYQFTGNSGGCTITIPSTPKLFLVQNLCTDGNSFNLVTANAGTTGIVQPTTSLSFGVSGIPSLFQLFFCDGTNVYAIMPYSYNLATAGNAVIGAVGTVNPPTHGLQIGGNLLMPSVPSSSSGLPSGTVWRNGTTLMIV